MEKINNITKETNEKLKKWDIFFPRAEETMEIEWLNTEPNMDRRQKKTRLAVEKALLTLLQQKALEQITISELAELADINRKTFYNNYNSIDDVIRGLDDKISAFIFSSLPKQINITNEIEIYNLLLELIHSLEPNKEILRHIVKYNKGSFIMGLLQMNLHPYIAKCLNVYNISETVIPYINAYVVSGLCALFYQWLDDDDFSGEQLALLAYNLTSSAIKLDNYKDI